MKKLTIDLENCHGIKSLSAEFDFSSGRTFAIYAPNGAMKSSFADTFKDIAEGKPSGDRVFPERKSSRKITDETGTELPPRSVMVIRNYEDFAGSTEEMATLLVNPELRTEYEKLHRDLTKEKTRFLSAIREQSGSKKDLESEISSAIMLRDKQFYEALDRVQKEVESQLDAPFEDIQYDVIFNDQVLDVLGKKDFTVAIDAYVRRYNELMDKSTYFKRGVFNYYNASKIAKTLEDNGFFEARHSVSLNADTSLEIKDVKQLERLISKELEGIASDTKLRQKFGELQKFLEKNQAARDFRDYISSREHILPLLANVEAFKQDLFKSYFKARFESYKALTDEHARVLVRTKAIEEKAKKQRTQWQLAIEVFNARFFVPFKLHVVNFVEVMLGAEKIPVLGFSYLDGKEERALLQENLLRVLSTGEKKALYVLNLVFEIERRQQSHQETVFVVDDIADSFDYKNKYAIIQYLKDISEEPYFHQIILTHNFDFFRTIQSRGLVAYSHCLMAFRTADGIILRQAEGIKNPFVLDWKPKFLTDDKKKVACIPFMRNLIEYTRGTGTSEYATLTSLLHWKRDSESITEADVVAIYHNLFGGRSGSSNGKRVMVPIIVQQAEECLKSADTMSLENKIVLSIAIRLTAERFMVAKLGIEVLDGIEENQTHKLVREFKTRFAGDPAIETLALVILMTPENIHLNSFMYEPILDMSDEHLRKLYERVSKLGAESKRA